MEFTQDEIIEDLRNNLQGVSNLYRAALDECQNLRDVLFELEPQLDILAKAKDQADLCVDKYIEAIKWKENALKMKDEEITRLNRIIVAGEIDLTSLNEIKALHNNKVTALRRQIDQLLDGE